MDLINDEAIMRSKWLVGGYLDFGDLHGLILDPWDVVDDDGHVLSRFGMEQKFVINSCYDLRMHGYSVSFDSFTAIGFRIVIFSKRFSLIDIISILFNISYGCSTVGFLNLRGDFRVSSNLSIVLGQGKDCDD